MTKQKVLALLKEADGYVSGQQLCDQLAVSRTAVWKAVSQLKKEGYKIEAVQNKGYRLVEDLLKLSEQELDMARKASWAGCKYIYKDVIDSTNLEAARQADHLPHGAVAVADEQTAGRGRRGRKWISVPGENAYFSILLKPDFEAELAPMLTLLMALAVTYGIECVYGCETGIKWPNDIVVNGRKVCGILTEMRAEPDFIHHVVIGVGINTAQMDFPGDELQYATSLLKETGLKRSRAELIGEVLYQFEQLYDRFCEERSLGFVQKSYNERLVNLGKTVKVLNPRNSYIATAQGINEKGELIVVKEDGTQDVIYAGEVSVRGIYGYV